MQRYSSLVDQITAYDARCDPLNLLTRFLDGLKPGVRVLVAIQQPPDLDTTYTMALLYEEMGDGSTTWNSATSSAPTQRRAHVQPQPLLQPPARWIPKTVEEKKNSEASRASAEDKWTHLKEFRRSKGLCFVCGEKWGRDHQCKTAIQLHVVQEMIEYLQASEEESLSETKEPDTPNQQLLLLSAVTISGQPATKSLQLEVNIQGGQFKFLVDSGSSACFLDQHLADRITGCTPLPHSIRVQVAGGRVLECKDQFTALTWQAQGYTFCDDFRVLALQSYDGIIGLDWLAKHSPMITHWAQRWIAFPIGDELVVLHGDVQPCVTHALVELQLIQPNTEHAKMECPPEISALLEEFSSVFAEPTGLPPTRQYDHHIPLIPRARLVSMRPYRVAPELKTEIERQVKELLRQGVITHSNSPFASPVLLVKKIDKSAEPNLSIPPEWRLVIDYRHLNALTLKGKYPLPVIDELLDELSGAKWFSKLDLRAGYHQIRLAPGEEAKTAFQTHNGHYKFKVMAFGLSGAPATFQHAMNASLEPVLRKFALVFFTTF